MRTGSWRLIEPVVCLSVCVQFSVDGIQLETEGKKEVLPSVRENYCFGSCGWQQLSCTSLSLSCFLLPSEGAERNSLEKVCLRASELISCEWCSLRKLPVLFFQTSEEECVRLRTQLHMSREESGQWYDCSGDRESATASQHTSPAIPLSFVPRHDTFYPPQSLMRSSSCSSLRMG